MHAIGYWLNDKFWERVIKRFSDDLEKIIKNAPRVEKIMKVYRGTHDDYFLKSNLKNKNYYLNDGFISTSLSRVVAENVKQNQLEFSECCILVITLLPGSHVLPLFSVSQYPNEQEILLGKETVYLIRKQKRRCKKGNQNVLVSDIVVVK